MFYDQFNRPLVPKDVRSRQSRAHSELLSILKRTLANPDTLDVSTYERMLDTDETVSAAVEFIQLSVINKIGEYRHPSKRIQRFIEQNLGEMRTKLPKVVEGITGGVWAGHSATETVYTERGGKVVTLDMPSIPQRSYEYELETSGDNVGCLKGIQQRQSSLAGRTKFIEAAYLLHWAHRGRDGNLYGSSRLSAAWKWWFPKDVLIGPWVRTLERYQAPIAVVKTQNPNNPVEVDGESMTKMAYLTKAMVNLSDQANVVVDPSDTVEFLEIKRAFGSDFEGYISFANKMIFRASLMPSLLFDAGEVGSNALGSKQYEIYQRTIWKMRNEICDALIDQWISRLIILNFGERADGNYGNFEAQLLEEEDLKLWAEIFFSLVKAGVIRPELPQDFNWMRAKLNLPAGVDPKPLPPEGQSGAGSGKDGLPGDAPDGLDDMSPEIPRAAPKAPKTKQGRPENE